MVDYDNNRSNLEEISKMHESHGRTLLREAVRLNDIKEKDLVQRLLEDATKNIQQSIDIGGKRVGLCDLMGEIYFEKEDYESADKWFSFELKEYPKNTKVISSLGYCALELKSFSIALNRFRQAFESNPNNPDNLYNVAFCLTQLGRFNEAQFNLENYFRTFDVNEDSEAHCLLGICYKENEDKKKAIISFRIAIKLDPEGNRAYHPFGVLLRDEGRIEEADKFLQKALNRENIPVDREERDVNLLLDAGKTKLLLGDYDNANTLFLDACEIAPQIKEIHYLLGISYYQIARNKKELKKKGMLEDDDDYKMEFSNAADTFHTAKHMGFDEKDLDLYLGISYFEIGDYYSAEHFFKICITENDCHSKAHYFLALIYEDDDNITTAFEYSKKAFDSDPDNEDIANLYYKLLLSLNENEKESGDCSPHVGKFDLRNRLANQRNLGPPDTLGDAQKN